MSLKHIEVDSQHGVRDSVENTLGKSELVILFAQAGHHERKHVEHSPGNEDCARSKGVECWTSKHAANEQEEKLPWSAVCPDKSLSYSYLDRPNP